MRVVVVVLAAAFTLMLALPAVAETKETTVEAEGMYCINCEARVESALGGLKGVQSVTADHDSETAKVVYDPAKVAPEDMVATIDNQTAYSGGTPGQEAGDSDGAQGSSGSSGEASGDTGDSGDSGVAQADFQAAGTSSGQEGASILPTASLIIAGAAVLLLVLAGGAWLAMRR
jgi:copper chaperone CopZ